MRMSFLGSDRTYGARRVWHNVLAEGFTCGLHRIERLMWKNAMKARPRNRRLPTDTGERVISTIAPNVLDRQFPMLQSRTGSGSLILLTYGQPKGGFMWRQSLICSHGALLVGQ